MRWSSSPVGDYAFVSNDRETLWRVCRGEEVGGDENERYVTVWQLWRWRFAIEDVIDRLDPGDWDAWELSGSWYDSRAQAIGQALHWGES